MICVWAVLAVIVWGAIAYVFLRGWSTPTDVSWAPPQMFDSVEWEVVRAGVWKASLTESCPWLDDSWRRDLKEPESFDLEAVDDGWLIRHRLGEVAIERTFVDDHDAVDWGRKRLIGLFLDGGKKRILS